MWQEVKGYGTLDDGGFIHWKEPRSLAADKSQLEQMPWDFYTVWGINFDRVKLLRFFGFVITAGSVAFTDGCILEVNIAK